MKLYPHPLLLTSLLLVCSPVVLTAQTKQKAPPKAQAVTPAEEGAARLRTLPIESGKIVLVAHIGVGELPARTVVNLLLQPAKGSNIKVEAWLPDAEKWNGRFLGLGNGGAAGKINPDSLVGPLSQGFAVATTDMGTAPNSDSGIGNREVWKDFGHRATHLMTVAAKECIKAYYGKAPEFSYFNGGSTGGQQALQEAQRYPEDYDGIVANVPAHCRTPLHAYFLWNDQILRACPFTELQEVKIIAAGNAYMASRELPQTAGKMVSDPRCTAQDIEAVIALARSKDATLTDKHADALRKLFGGPKHAVTGERIFNGIPFGADFKSAHGHLYLFQWVFGKEKNLATIDFGKDIDTYTAELAPYLNAENADLSAFEARGGKLLMITGSADAVVPYHATLDYYERVIEHFGSVEKAQSFARLYFVPGMGHGPGPGINSLPRMLKLVMDWREKGIAPGKIQAQRILYGKTTIEIPLYPYPAKAAVDPASGGKGFVEVVGPRGGVERVAERFRGKAGE
ncbi:tannase/feruloyl esterase [Roseimicrobium gellanilyticum]|uniref:Tannase/feruloyl esterase n=1 Tax=Roseimicrobium gellanilyticum TaxID=748857 RepID=A0A366HBB2_9BACT|nr:tannase/feruloyl esterase family alpha/beta hydrolase [Roseimicrobium gellanilyticum]RBP39623.1 tannase/feruloyl esterase [Roseimicrobium gellanilyticum]